MSGVVHKVFRAIYLAIGLILFVILTYWGYAYYTTSIEERPFRPEHELLKPSGPYGHGLGIIGTLLILIGVFSYIARKKNKFLPRVGALKYWLEFHIFLCSIGPLLILFHTAFKFGGIVSISFWSMVAVVLSGVIGRFIYIQIPRTIQGRELSLAEIKEVKSGMNQQLKDKYGLDETMYEALMEIAQVNVRRELNTGKSRIEEWMMRGIRTRSAVKTLLQNTSLSDKDKRGVFRVLKEEMRMNAKIERLNLMQTLFRHWHIAHLPLR